MGDRSRAFAALLVALGVGSLVFASNDAPALAQDSTLVERYGRERVAADVVAGLRSPEDLRVDVRGHRPILPKHYDLAELSGERSILPFPRVILTMK